MIGRYVQVLGDMQRNCLSDDICLILKRSEIFMKHHVSPAKRDEFNKLSMFFKIEI